MNTQSKKFVRIEELATITGLPVGYIRTLQAARKLPFIKSGHRTIFYDPAKVIAALERLETKAVA